MTQPTARAVVFDVGGVPVDWDPRHLCRKLISDETAMEWFLSEVCTPEWHAQHDLGVPFGFTALPLAESHPEWADAVHASEDRFDEIWGGPVDAMAVVLVDLHDQDMALYAATNWPKEAWGSAREAFGFLCPFDGSLVSGEVGVSKNLFLNSILHVTASYNQSRRTLAPTGRGASA